MRELCTSASVLLLLALTPAGVLAAQGREHRKLCFQSAPLPRCGTSWVTEFGGGVLLSSNRSEAPATLFQWNLGAVKNLNPSAGIGGAAFFTWSESAFTVGAAPRLRYWVSPRVSFDLSPGLIVFQGGSRNLGFNGQLAANFGPHVALTTTLQVTNAGSFVNNRQLHRVDWFAGARLNGKVGAVTGILAPILTFFTYVALFSAYSD